MSILARHFLGSGMKAAGGLTSYSLNSANLDGSDDYFNTADKALFTCSAVSVGAWVKPSGTGSYVVLRNRPLGSNFAGFALELASGKVGSITLFEDNSGNYLQVSSASGSVPANTWTHVAMTCSTAAGLKVYVNGSDISAPTAGSGTIGSSDSGSDFRVGVTHSGTRDFVGGMTGVFYTNSVLSAAQISELYNSGKYLAYDALSAGLQTAFNGTNGDIWNLCDNGSTQFPVADRITALSGTAANDLTNNGSTAFTATGLEGEA